MGVASFRGKWVQQVETSRKNPGIFEISWYSKLPNLARVWSVFGSGLCRVGFELRAENEGAQRRGVSEAKTGLEIGMN